jgi:hypothetical protein
MITLLQGLGWLALVLSGSLLAICLRSFMTDEETFGSPYGFVLVAAMAGYWGYLLVRDGSRDGIETNGRGQIPLWEWDQEEW